METTIPAENPLVHRFTRENAAELGKRGLEARKRKKEAEQARLATIPEDADEASRLKRVLLQMQRCDKLLMSCSGKDFPALTAAKERLWKLIYPTAGVLRPKRASDRPARPTIAPISPSSTPQAPAGPEGQAQG